MTTERSAPEQPTAPTTSPNGQDRSVGDLVHEATTNMSTLIRGEIELAKLEVTTMVKKVATGSVFFVATGVVLFFSLFFPFIALAEGLVEIGLPRWASYLITWGVLLVIAAVLALLGYRTVKKARKPERTLATVRDTAQWARHPTKQGHPDGAHSGM